MKLILILLWFVVQTCEIYALPKSRSTSILSKDDPVLMHENKVRYIIVRKEDTYFKISLRNGITLRQLLRYNESFKHQDVLREGEKIYLDPRRYRSKTKKTIILPRRMSLRELAQEEALKLKPLLRRNKACSADEKLPIGKEIQLR